MVIAIVHFHHAHAATTTASDLPVGFIGRVLRSVQGVSILVMSTAIFYAVIDMVPGSLLEHAVLHTFRR